MKKTMQRPFPLVAGQGNQPGISYKIQMDDANKERPGEVGSLEIRRGETSERGNLVPSCPKSGHDENGHGARSRTTFGNPDPKIPYM